MQAQPLLPQPTSSLAPPLFNKSILRSLKAKIESQLQQKAM